MPRARKPGSGGPRSGTPGTAYANRSDLNRPYVGGTYGTATAQQSAMRQMPVAPPGTAAPGAGPQPPPPPGAGGPFDRPTERPGEPVTAGLPMGPGPGPEALGGYAPQNDADLDLQALAPYIGALELMASQPGATISSRNFVRRLRGAIPPEAFDQP